MEASKYAITIERAVADTRQVDPTRLTAQLNRLLNHEELLELIYRLRLDPDNVPGATKEAKARALVELCARQGRLQALWEVCRQSLPAADWELLLEPPEAPDQADGNGRPRPEPSLPAPSPSGARRLNPRLAAAALLFLAAGFVAGWLLPGANRPAANGRSPSPSGSDLGTLLENFESPDALSQLAIRQEDAADTQLALSTDAAFDGRQSLKIETRLQETLLGASPKTAQLLFTGRDVGTLRRRVAVMRVFAPADAPTNISAQIFLINEETEWPHWGTFHYLTPGEWTTFTWDTQDTPPWGSARTLGMNFMLQVSRPDAPADAPVYTGALFVDAIQLIDLPQTYAGAPALDHVLTVAQANGQPLLYQFEGLSSPQPEMSALNTPDNFHTASVQISQADALSLDYGSGSLQLNLNLKAYDHDTETGYGGVRLDLGSTVQVDAAVMWVYVPAAAVFGAADNFRASFVGEAPDSWVHSSSTPLVVGQWSPVFWGTRFAFGEGYVCHDLDLDGQCDDPTGYLYHIWNEPQIRRLQLRVWREDEPYAGPVYVDDLVLYQQAASISP